MGKRTPNSMLRTFFKKENRHYLFVLTALLFIVFLSAFAKNWTATQRIEKFIISGNSFIPGDEILSIAVSSTASGISKASESKENERKDIDFLILKEAINKHPFVLTSYIMQKSSNEVEIEIVERNPVAILVRDNGDLCYSDQTGSILPYRLSLKFGELPLVRNIFRKKSADTVALQGAISIIGELIKSDNDIFGNQISEIEYNPKSRTYNLISSGSGYYILFGKAENIANKIQVYSEFMISKMNSIDARTIKNIDIRWKGRVVVLSNEIYNNL